jgi:uncharacterized membrane protein
LITTLSEFMSTFAYIVVRHLYWSVTEEGDYILKYLSMFKFDAVVCQYLRSVYVDVSLDIVTLLVIIEGFPLISLLFLLSWVLVLIFLFLFSFISFRWQPLERSFKACLCTHPKGKPIVHNENTKKYKVWFTFFLFFFLK